MKWLLLALCLLGSVSVQAQQAAANSEATPYRYCALIVVERYFSNPSRIYLDYGQDAPGAVADPEMAEMAQNISKSTFIIDVLNYLSRHQWEVFAVTNVPSSTTSTFIDSQTRYLLRRRKP
jgi:hypothetical protein